MSSVLQQIHDSFSTENTDRNRKRWAQFIIDNDIDLKELLPLLTEEKKTATQFVWMMGDLCDKKPELVKPHVAYCYANRDKVKVTGYNRSLAKFFSYAGIPEELEGTVADELFQQLKDPKVQVQAKSYVLYALFHLSEKYPELKPELKASIESVRDMHSFDFKKRAMNILEKLRAGA